MISRYYVNVLYFLVLWALVRHSTWSNTLFNQIFEVLLIIIAIINFRVINLKIVPLFTLNVIYLSMSSAYVLFFTNDNFLDFLLIYKFFIYAVFFCFMFQSMTLKEKVFFKFYKLFLLVFAIKYFTSSLVSDIRPRLFFENNYELMLLSLLFYLYYSLKGSVSIIHQVVISFVFILSKSISGLLILVFVLIVVNHKQIIKRLHLLIPGVIGVIFSSIFVLKERMGGEINFSQHTRFRFLEVFLDETQDWGLKNYLFGAERISSLSETACRRLGYWQSLFSYSGDGSCYSVVLHSYVFRAIFDHGILGFIFINYFVFKLIVKSGYLKQDGFTVVGIVLLNALSVSSYNSVYFAIGILFYLIVRKPQPTNYYA